MSNIRCGSGKVLYICLTNFNEFIKILRYQWRVILMTNAGY